MGESAGAQSVMFHLMMSTSSHLFHRAIMMSNPAVFQYPTYDQANEIADMLANQVGCTSDQDTMACLRYSFFVYKLIAFTKNT